jgi:hypothetical protein
MKTEARKVLKHGYWLTEQELRRIVDSLIQQMERVSLRSDIITSFELKFQNGVISETQLIDDVISQENIGSGAINRLKIHMKSMNNTVHPEISLEFINAEAENESDLVAIRYHIVGDDRDWVFVTSSQLEERLGRIKRFVVKQVFGQWHTFCFQQYVCSLYFSFL